MNLSTRSFRTFTHSGIQLVALAAIVGLAGCHHKSTAASEPAPPPETAAAPTATLTADPLAIDLGQSVVLNWRTQNAATVTIDGIGNVNLNGTSNASPSTSTNFHLTATGPGGTAEANVRVTVRVPEVPTAPAAGPADMTPDALFHQNVQDIFFDYDSADIRPDAATSIAAAAAFLTSHPSAKVLIGGYCDDRGSAEYNLALGETRANAAKDALVTAGVPASRLRVISYGKEKQFCTDENDACWQQNRRAQFSLDR
jgi:peptidoglycan-associated lipoprotein